MDAVLSNRKAAIEDLTATIAERVAQLEQGLQAFQSTVSKTLGNAQDRARQIANVVADTTEASARALDNQHQALSAAAEAERARLTEALKTNTTPPSRT